MKYKTLIMVVIIAIFILILAIALTTNNTSQKSNTNDSTPAYSVVSYVKGKELYPNESGSDAECSWQTIKALVKSSDLTNLNQVAQKIKNQYEDTDELTIFFYLEDTTLTADDFIEGDQRLYPKESLPTSTGGVIRFGKCKTTLNSETEIIVDQGK